MTQKETKEKEKNARETLGKYFYDISKLIFAAAVLTNITSLFGIADFSWKSILVIVFGITATFLTAAMGNKILKM